MSVGVARVRLTVRVVDLSGMKLGCTGWNPSNGADEVIRICMGLCIDARTAGATPSCSLGVGFRVAGAAAAMPCTRPIAAC